MLINLRRQIWAALSRKWRTANIVAIRRKRLFTAYTDIETGNIQARSLHQMFVGAGCKHAWTTLDQTTART